jgi:hypothetical protein
MASQSISFPIQLSLNKDNNRKANEIIQSKWAELLRWKELNNIHDEEFDFTLEEFADEVRLSL